MTDARDALLSQLERHYREQGWRVGCDGDGVLVATGPGGVSWHGMAVVADDLVDDAIGPRLVDLTQRRMPVTGELFPVDLLPDPACADDLEALLERLPIRRRHVSVYALVA